MFPRKFIRTSVIIAFLFASGGSLQFVSAQVATNESSQNTLPPSVRAILEQQASALSAVHIEYTQERICESQPGMTGKTKYAEDFDGDHFYSRQEDPGVNSNGKVEVLADENSFDGQYFYFGEKMQSLSGRIIKGRMDDDTDPIHKNRLLDFPYLEDISFSAPHTIADLGRKPLIRSLVLQYLNESYSNKFEVVGDNVRVTVNIPDKVLIAARETSLNEEEKRLKAEAKKRAKEFKNFPPVDVAKEMEALKQSQKVAPVRTVIFLLDPKRGYAAIEREEWTAAKQLIARIITNKWKHYDSPDIWLPSRCEAMYYTFPMGLREFSDSPVVSITHKLTAISFGATRGVEFALDQRQDYRQSGTHITDRSAESARANPDHEVTYVLGVNGTLLRESAMGARREMSSRHRLFWIIAILPFGVLPLGFWIVQKRKQG